jgi:hypothetical protein
VKAVKKDLHAAALTFPAVSFIRIQELLSRNFLPRFVQYTTNGMQIQEKEWKRYFYDWHKICPQMLPHDQRST